MASQYMSMTTHSLAILICCMCIVSVRGSDPDPVVDILPNVTEFVLRNSFKNAEVTSGPGGLRVALSTTIFPALKSQGLTSVQFKLKPCGENPPHTHPRATELLTMISGGPIQAGFVDTSGKSHIYILYPGDLIIFPRALLHFELNVGNKTAYFISALNSENPGTLTAAEAVLSLPARAAAAAFNQDLKTIAKLKKQIYAYGPILQLDKKSGCVPSKDITIGF